MHDFAYILYDNYIHFRLICQCLLQYLTWVSLIFLEQCLVNQQQVLVPYRITLLSNLKPQIPCPCHRTGKQVTSLSEKGEKLYKESKKHIYNAIIHDKAEKIN